MLVSEDTVNSDDEASSEEVIMDVGSEEAENLEVEAVTSISEDVVVSAGILDSAAVVDAEDVVVSEEMVESDAVTVWDDVVTSSVLKNDELDSAVEEDSTEMTPEVNADVEVNSDEIDSVAVDTSELFGEETVASKVFVVSWDVADSAIVVESNVAVSELPVVSEVLVVSKSLVILTVEEIVSEITVDVDEEAGSDVELGSVGDSVSELDVVGMASSDVEMESDDVFD